MKKQFFAAFLILLSFFARGAEPIVLTDINAVKMDGADCLTSQFLNSEMTTRDFMLGKLPPLQGRYFFMIDFACKENSIGVGINGKGYKLYAKNAEDFEHGTTYFSKDKKISVFIKHTGTVAGDESPDVKGCIDTYNNFLIKIQYYQSKKIVKSTEFDDSCLYEKGERNGIEEVVNAELEKISHATQGKTTFNPVVAIGISAPFSGSLAQSGVDFFNGAQLAVDNINARKPTINGKEITIRLVKEDEAGDLSRSTAHLISQSVNAVIGYLDTPSAVEAASFYWAAGIPLISPAVINNHDAGHAIAKIVFPLSLDHAELFDASIQYARKNTQDDGIVLIREHGTLETKAGNPTSAEYKSVNFDAYKVPRNADSLINYEKLPASLSIKGTASTVLLDVSTGAIPYVISKVGGNKSIRHIFISPANGVCPDSVGEIDPNIEIACFAPVASGALNSEGMASFKEQYQHKFGVDPAMYAPYGHDAIQILFAAMLQARSVAPEDYQLFLAKKTNYHGLTGDISFMRGSQALNANYIAMYNYSGGNAGKPVIISIK